MKKLIVLGSFLVMVLGLSSCSADSYDQDINNYDVQTNRGLGNGAPGGTGGNGGENGDNPVDKDGDY